MNYTTYLCAGTLVLVADALSEADRQDGLDALLFCQTVASRKCLDEVALDAWMEAEGLALRKLGAMLISEPGISLSVTLPGAFTLYALAGQALDQLVSDSSYAVPFEALSRQPSASPAEQSIREHVMQTENRVQFRLCVISPGMKMAVVAIGFKYDEEVAGNILNHRFSHEKLMGNLTISGYQALLETEDYDLSRPTVISLLGNLREEKIKQLV